MGIKKRARHHSCAFGNGLMASAVALTAGRLLNNSRGARSVLGRRGL